MPASWHNVLLFLEIYIRGTDEFFGVMGKVDIINSTLGKALGGAAGGYTTGPQELITLLRQRSRPYLFSNSLPPPVVAAAIKVHFRSMESCDSHMIVTWDIDCRYLTC